MSVRLSRKVHFWKALVELNPTIISDFAYLVYKKRYVAKSKIIPKVENHHDLNSFAPCYYRVSSRNIGIKSYRALYHALCVVFVFSLSLIYFSILFGKFSYKKRRFRYIMSNFSTSDFFLPVDAKTPSPVDAKTPSSMAFFPSNFVLDWIQEKMIQNVLFLGF